MLLFYKSNLCHFGFKCLVCAVAHFDKRQAAFANLVAHDVKGFFNGNGVNVGEKGVDKRQILNLKRCCCLKIAVKSVLANVVGFLGAYIGKNRNNTLATQRKDGNNLVIVAGVDVKVVAAKGTGTGSCGPATLPQYSIDASKELTFNFVIAPSKNK